MLSGHFRPSVDAKEVHCMNEAREQSGPQKGIPPGLSAQAQGTAGLMGTMPENFMKVAKLQSG